MPDIRLGDYAVLPITKRVDFGVYLDGGRAGEILLPARYVPQGAAVGDELKVFIYLDQEERLIATTEEPLAKVGDFACLEVSWVNEYGAFLRWGLMKDLFCPFSEQKKKMVKGQRYIVHVHIDEESYRIVASAKVDRFISKDVSALKAGQCVSLLVWQKTDLGFKVIINNAFAGLLYDNELFTTLHTGDRVNGFIHAVRADGKVDVRLQKEGREHTTDFSHTLLDYIREHEGFCPLCDSSSPEDIYAAFAVSKKVFKKAVGELYKQRKITIQDDGLHLVRPTIKQ